MNRVFCNCLNVIIDVSHEDSRIIEGQKLIDDDHMKRGSPDDFFTSQVLDIKLGLGGIEMQQPLLIKERIIADWKVFHCANCNIDTHAIHKIKGLDRVLGNMKLQRSSEDIQLIKDRPEYSPVFKLVLENNPSSDNEDGPVQATLTLQQYLTDATQKVNAMIKQFLKIQEEAMKERIRLFVEEEKQKFDSLHRKVLHDKKSFLRVVHQKEEKAMKDSLSDAMNDSSFSVDSSDERFDQLSTTLPTFTTATKIGKPVRPDDFSHLSGSLPLSKQPQMPSRVLVGKSRESPKKVKTASKPQPVMRRRLKSDPDDDTMFDLDGFQDSRSNQPFFESDEDSSGDSNSLESSGGYGVPLFSRGLAGDRVYATSVPVGIPLIEPQGKCSYEDEDPEDYEPAPSPDKMAESIKALARSIQDSTSMFGELPRPRYNTMPLK